MTFKRMIAVLAGYVGARFLGAGLGLLTQLVLVRALSPPHVTQVFIAMSGAAFMSLLMNGGETQLASTQMPKLLAHGERRAIAAFHGFVLRNMVLLLLVLAAGLGTVWSLRLLSDDVAIALAVGLVAAPMSGYMRYNAMVANSLRWFPLSYVPDFIVRPGLFLVTIFVFLVTGLCHNVELVLGAFAVYVWGVALGQAALMQGEALKPSHWVAYRPLYARALRPRSIALLLVSIVSFAFADVVMLLAGFLFAPDDAAVVGVTVRLAAIAGFVLQAAQLFTLPDFTESLARREVGRANGMLWRTNSLTVVMALAGLVAALLLGRWVLAVFGEHYEKGAALLTLFLVGQSIRALGGMNQNLLAIGGYQVRTAWPCFVALLVLCGAAFLLVPSAGLLGIGYAVIAAELAWMLFLALQAQMLCGRRADLLWLARNA